ncbi:hypothetical protein MKQ70_04085 [Chitinophaga sedimenti]|uniref:hypothetical protein n=1 Tax=Chitinophaga sedimenti TaxID=2033606 RepID=UPI00200510C7|nr:hypothetical protein [Chitinophaga sedimenti]MCK7554234.1 hypothetical protein [Chitinophaga sedimenti]
MNYLQVPALLGETVTAKSYFMHLIAKVAALGVALSFIAPVSQAPACTRVVYKGLNNLVITARSMDWREDIMTNLWIFPGEWRVMAKWGRSP